MTPQELEKRIQEAKERGDETLDLSSQGLTQLPESLGQLTVLKALFLTKNQLIELPESLGQLTGLQSLSLDKNQLTQLPESLGRLTALQTLELNNNQLTQLPESLDRLTALQNLFLSTNQLTQLPESLGQLTALRHLYIYDNQLAQLPESLCRLTALQDLYLFKNQLTQLPECLGQLTALRRLYLSDNQLARLPKSFGQLTTLEELYLHGNQFSQLPESLGQLTALKELYLYNNQLNQLPQSLLALAKRGTLFELFLHENEGLELPPEVLGPPWVECKSYRSDGKDPARPLDILEYYFRTRGGARPLNEAKLILVGRGEVGKTCVVGRLVQNVFLKDTSKTDGIQITQWPLALSSQEQIKLHVWDFGGQEIMHATHQFFLTQRSLYLLVLAGRAGGEDTEAEYWLQLIESFGGESPVIVVLNKIKEHPFDLNRRALQTKYPSIREFVRVDCEDGRGFDELRAAICRETDRLEGLRFNFPAAWFAIKDRLAGMAERGENLLSYEDYENVCLELGEKEKDAQDTLAVHLHSLGIALNYRDDPRLNDTHVLSPHWVTNGIYKILNWPELEARKGVLRMSDLASLLDAKKYPRGKHAFLLDLMKKFETCFEFPDDPERRYIVPELLDKQEPAAAGDFDAAECLNFQYHYNLVPEGLLPRFIVRTHRLSEGQPRWRTGAVLKFEDNTALVKADIQARKVFISVRGPRESRRQLLAVIRSDFERIHGDIKKLQVTEMVPVPGRPDAVVPYKKLTALEKKRVATFTEVFGEDVVDLDVQELLNGVDLEGSRKVEPDLRQRGALAERVFISYSHKDETLRAELETHLKLLQREGKIATWTDRKILAGGKWAGEIDRNLEEADIVLLLVSADFVASDYCYEKEMTRALERDAAGEAIVIPIIVRDVDWHTAPFAKCQGLPKDGKAVTLWADRDAAWKNVALGIREAVEAHTTERKYR